MHNTRLYFQQQHYSTILAPFTTHHTPRLFSTLTRHTNSSHSTRYKSFHHPSLYQKRQTGTQHLIQRQSASFSSQSPQKPRSWLGRRVAQLRLWGMRGTKEEEKWDPWTTPARDLEIGTKNTDTILKNAQAARERQLEQIEKYRKKAADKEASIRTPIAYAKQKKLEKVPFTQKIKNAIAWIKNPRNYIHRYFYDCPPASELSFSQRCIFLYGRYTLVAVILFAIAFPRLPIVRDIIDELARHRDRKKRGVLGLDDYCTPEKQFTKLKFLRTNDWSFDIRYLQKMCLRDVYVVKNIAAAMTDITKERIYHLENMANKLVAFEVDPKLRSNVNALTPFQRDAILNLTEYHTNLSQELKQAKGFLELIDTEWIPQASAAWDNTDVQITSFWNTYLLSTHKRDALLDTLIEHQKSVEKWRETLEDEYNRHLARVEELEMLAQQLLVKEFVQYTGHDLSKAQPQSPQPTQPPQPTQQSIEAASQQVMDDLFEIPVTRRRKHPGLTAYDQNTTRGARQAQDDILGAEYDKGMQDIQGVISGTVSPENYRPKRYSPEELDELLKQMKLEEQLDEDQFLQDTLQSQASQGPHNFQRQMAHTDDPENNFEEYKKNFGGRQPHRPESSTLGQSNQFQIYTGINTGAHAIDNIAFDSSRALHEQATRLEQSKNK